MLDVVIPLVIIVDMKPRCPTCYGDGYHALDLDRPAYDTCPDTGRRAVSPRWTDSEPCDCCDGSGHVEAPGAHEECLGDGHECTCRVRVVADAEAAA